MRTPKRLSPAEKLINKKVKAERVRRQKIEAYLPPPDRAEYTRIEDLPPLHPNDEARLKAEFFALVERVQSLSDEEEAADSHTQGTKDQGAEDQADWHQMNQAVNGLRAPDTAMTSLSITAADFDAPSGLEER